MGTLHMHLHRVGEKTIKQLRIENGIHMCHKASIRSFQILRRVVALIADVLPRRSLNYDEPFWSA